VTTRDPGVGARRAVLALTSHDTLGDTGRHTGAYMSEVVDAWEVLTAAGYDVHLTSVLGGRPPLEAVDEADPRHRAFLDDPTMRSRLANTRRAGELDPADYALVFVAGGHGAAWDLPDDAGLAALIRGVYETEGVVAAVCHGPAALVNVRLSDGSYLVEGRQVSSFSNDEERAVGMTGIVPFLLADKLTERGAKYVSAPSFIPYVVADGRLVTGQNPPSATAVAQRAVELLDQSLSNTL